MKKRNIIRIMIVLLLGFIFLYPTRYKFLLLNITLAYIPIEIGYLTEKNEINKILKVFIFLLWILFLPNISYLLTDLIHLDILDLQFKSTGVYKNFPSNWRDFCLLVGSVVSLNIIGFHSINSVVNKFKKEFQLNEIKTNSIVIVLIVLSSVGVYMGRFLRLHSIHAIINLKDTIYKVITMFDMRFLNFVISFSLLQVVLFYLIIKYKNEQLD